MNEKQGNNLTLLISHEAVDRYIRVVIVHNVITMRLRINPVRTEERCCQPLWRGRHSLEWTVIRARLAALLRAE